MAKKKRKIPPYIRKIINSRKRVAYLRRQKKLYSEDWDIIRRKVYARDGYRCLLCDKKGKINAHHIIPVAISHDNTLSNLITLCSKCHRKLEAIGYKILKEGGHRADVRRVEFSMIAEAKRKRHEKYKKKLEEERIKNGENNERNRVTEASI